MRDPKAKRLASLPKLPRADAAIAMAFALGKDGSLNLPTRSIVRKTVQLHKDGLARRLIFFGSGQANDITEAAAMDGVANDLGVDHKFRSKVHDPGFKGNLKERDMVLLGEELDRLDVDSSYLVAHPLHLWRARMHCEKRFTEVTFHPIEAERLYDRESGQIRCRAETFFIPWNIAAFAEHFIKGKI